MTAIQARFAPALEPTLLRQPLPQLHASVAWLLPVARDFDAPKDEIWAVHGEDWLKLTAAVMDAAPPMRLRYQHVVLTDAAIIAVAPEPNPVASVRRALTSALDLPWPIPAATSASCIPRCCATASRWPTRLA